MASVGLETQASKRSAFETLGLKMRDAQGLNKVKVFGIAFFSALAALITAPAALRGIDVFERLVTYAYPAEIVDRPLEIIDESGPRTLEYGEGSFLRRMRETVVYLPEKAIRSVQSYFQEVRVNTGQLDELDTKIKNYENSEDQTEILSNVRAGIVELRENQPLEPHPIDAFAKSLQKTHSFNYDSRLSNALPCESEGLPQLTAREGGLHFYPIGLGTRPIRHWVMVGVDTVNRTIEFYDPKGLSIADRASVPIDKYPSHTLEDLMDHISRHYTGEFPGEWTVVQNREPHQRDTYNCGVYISNYMRRRLEGEFFHSIESNGLSFEAASTTERALMVQKILDRTCPPDEPKPTKEDIAKRNQLREQDQKARAETAKEDREMQEAAVQQMRADGDAEGADLMANWDFQ